MKDNESLLPTARLESEVVTALTQSIELAERVLELKTGIAIRENLAPHIARWKDALDRYTAMPAPLSEDEAVKLAQALVSFDKEMRDIASYLHVHNYIPPHWPVKEIAEGLEIANKLLKAQRGK